MTVLEELSIQLTRKLTIRTATVVDLLLYLSLSIISKVARCFQKVDCGLIERNASNLCALSRLLANTLVFIYASPIYNALTNCAPSTMSLSSRTFTDWENSVRDSSLKS